MLSAQPAPAVTANANSPSKKPDSVTNSFARALGEGLIDVAFAFDGAFRPAGSMSLAERAAYGLRSNDKAVTHRTISAPMHGVLGTCPNREVVSNRVLRPLYPSTRTTGGTSAAMAAPPAAAVEEVRREARLRHASSSDAPSRRPYQDRTRYPAVRVAAIVGQARIDVVVTKGGRLASVMPWMR